MSRAKLAICALFVLLMTRLAGAADREGATPTQIATQARQFEIVDGDDIAFSRVENAEEFSQSRVAQITQDDKGFMWFGTAYGLNRFDGYGYTAFAGGARAHNQLSGVYVSAITKDRLGRLWIASDQGLDIFDPAKGTFSHIRYGNDSRATAGITFIYEDRSGTIWLCTTVGLYGLDSNGRTRFHFEHDADDPGSLGSNDVKAALEDRDGTFWVTHRGGLEAIDRANGRVIMRVPLQEQREIGVLEDRRGLLWIYRAGGSGLATFDRAARRLTTYSFVDVHGRPLPRFGIYSALEDSGGTLWFGTGGEGLLRVDLERQRVVRYRRNSGDPQSIGGDDVAALFQDRQENIWVAFHGTPLNMFPARKPPFRKLPTRPVAVNERAERMVNSILELDDRSLWISYYGMLLGFDQKTGERADLSRRFGLNTDVISMARDSRGGIWLGTVAGGLLHVDASSRVAQYMHDPSNAESIAGDTVDHVLEDHAENIWAATWGGLSRFDRKRGTFTTFRPQGMDSRYLVAAEDAAHRLWLGTNLHGLQRFDPATGEFVTYAATGAPDGISNGRVNAIHVGRNGVIWAGTQNGLDALDPTTGRVRSYRTTDGLPGNAVSCILEDDDGALWLGTNVGIARLDVLSGEVRTFTRADGLPGLDFTGWGSCYRGASKDMYFAGFAGATSFDPAQVRARSHTFPVQFTDLVIAGVPFPAAKDGVRPAVFPELGTLTLPYSRNSFSAVFASLSYANPRSARYRFRLAGLEQEWHVVGSDRRVASYNSLPPGNYQLEVQAASNAGDWSSVRALDFTVLRPWWQTTSFRVIASVLFVGLMWLAYDLRARRVQRQFEMRLNERVAERTRIARELHDSLLQGFHALMFRLQAVRNLLPMQPEQAAQALDETMARGDQTVEQARVAVTDLRTWSAEPDLELALHALAHEVPMMSTASAPELRIDVRGDCRAMIPLVRDDVLQIAREAFRNVLLHAKANVVQIEVNWDVDRFSLIVRDDGVGLDPGVIAQGRDGHWGLQGMRERTRQIGGRLEIQSETNRGTRVEISIPSARAYSKIPD